MAVELQVRLLGGFEVSTQQALTAPGAWRLRKAKTLVKMLALQPGHALPRDVVVDALWPDTDVDAARNNLHQVVHAARRAIETAGIAGSDALGWNDSMLVLGHHCAVVTDVERLDAAAKTLLQEGDVLGLAELLQAAAAELLPEDAYEPWAQQHVIAYREWRSQLVMHVVELEIEGNHPELAVTLLAPVVAAEPLHEPAQRALMSALAGAGRRSEALLVFERLRTALRDELGADPEPPTRALFRQLLTEPASPVVPAQRRADNLPARVMPLIGRERELTETDAALRRTRLLTLTGLGGVGKTSLAIEVARRRVADYAGDVHLVELGSVADSDQVVTQLARTLRLEVPSDAPPVESVVAQLRRRRLLLVLDNCEHLLDACASVIGELLRGCPEVAVLATSREPLRIDGELTWRTPSLGLPDTTGVPGLSDLAEVASIQLFVQRASALAAFELTDDNARAVAEICYRLDGIPLALELAAACIPFLTPQQVSERLGDALELLRRGDRATVDRQQTLAATLAWSHDLLADDERMLFRRLAVFTGSFRLEAVEEICGVGLGLTRVLSALARLVDTSLVTVSHQGDAARYRMLETVRQFAAEQLRNSGEGQQLRTAHCEWYLDFAERHDPQSDAGSADPAGTAMEPDYANLETALAWAMDQLPATALSLAVAMWRYWLAHGLMAEGRRWLQDVLDANPEPTALRARALFALAVFDVRRGSAGRLAELGDEAIRIRRSLDDRSELAAALHSQAVLDYMRGDWEQCWQRAEESRLVGGEEDHPIAITALHLQSMVLAGRGLFDEARGLIAEVRDLLATHREVDSPFFLPLSLGFAVEGTTGRVPRVFFEETVLPGRTVGARQADAYVLGSTAAIARLSGDLDEARGLVDEARSRFSAIGDRDGEARAMAYLGCLHRVAGDLPAARTQLERSLQLRRAIGDRRSVGLTQVALGVLRCTEGDLEGGRALIEDTLAGFEETHDHAAVAGIALSLASVHTEAAQDGRASRILLLTLPQTGDMPGNHRASGWGWLQLGDLQERRDRPADAARAYAEAARQFSGYGAVDGLREVNARGVAALQIAE